MALFDKSELTIDKVSQIVSEVYGSDLDFFFLEYTKYKFLDSRKTIWGKEKADVFTRVDGFVKYHCSNVQTLIDYIQKS